MFYQHVKKRDDDNTKIKYINTLLLFNFFNQQKN